MKIEDILKIRDNSYARLVNSVDYLGRALRENVVIFDIDSVGETVTLLSESQHLLHCGYSVNDDNVKLSGFKIRPADDLMSDEAIDAFVAEKISGMIAGLGDSRYDKANDNFSAILETFKGRHTILETRRELTHKLTELKKNTSIVASKEFASLTDLKESIVKFVKENAKALSEVPDIRNSIRINNALSKAFDVKKTTYTELIAEGIVLDNNSDSELYSLVCKRELVAREVYESKRSFSNMWVSNTKVKDLVQCMFTEDSIVAPLTELIKDVPYFALASKSELNEAFTKICSIDFSESTTRKMIREFTSVVFEMKKVAKKEIVMALNENYGININSLKFIPTFSDLAKVQGHLFKALAENAESTALQAVFTEASNMANTHCGIEVLDLSDYVKDVFMESMQAVCGHDISTLNEKFDMSVAGGRAAELIVEGGYYGDDDHDGQEEMDEAEKSDKKSKKNGKKKKKKREEEEEKEKEEYEAEETEKEETEETEKEETEEIEGKSKKPQFKKGTKAKEKVVKEGAEQVEMSDADLAAGGLPDPEEKEPQEGEGDADITLSEEEAMEVASDMESIISQLKVKSSDASPKKIKSDETDDDEDEGDN